MEGLGFDLPESGYCMDKKEAGNVFETQPEAGDAFEIFNWQLISR
jgi:hypothetical protein